MVKVGRLWVESEEEERGDGKVRGSEVERGVSTGNDVIGPPSSLCGLLSMVVCRAPWRYRHFLILFGVFFPQLRQPLPAALKVSPSSLLHHPSLRLATLTFHSPLQR